MKYYHLLFILFLSMVLPLPAAALETYTFKVTTGGEITYELLTIDHIPSGLMLKTPISLNYFDKTDNQVVWEVRDDEQGTALKAERTGNSIKLTGTYKNKDVEKEYTIDSLPWYQYPEVTLQEFALSGAPKREFRIISLHDLSLFKFQAIKMGNETINISGLSYDTIRIRIKATGFAGHFWHADYWFSLADGRYLRYQAVHGGPGTPPTIKELMAGGRE